MPGCLCRGPGFSPSSGNWIPHAVTKGFMCLNWDPEHPNKLIYLKKKKNQGVNLFPRTKPKHIFIQLVTQQEGLSSPMSYNKNTDHPVLLKEHLTVFIHLWRGLNTHIYIQSVSGQKLTTGVFDKVTGRKQMIKEQEKAMVLITLINLKLHIFAIMGYPLFNKIKNHQSFQN